MMRRRRQIGTSRPRSRNAQIVAMDEIVNQHARQHLVRMLDEHLEQREFAVAQRNALAAARRASA